LEQKYQNWSKLLLVLILVELVAGGGGRLLYLGVVSVRMILFSLAVFTFLIGKVCLGHNFNKYENLVVIVFAAGLTISSLIGLINGSSYFEILRDVKPISYILILPFFSSIKWSRSISDKLNWIMRWPPLLLAMIYLVLLLLWHSKLLNGEKIYEILSRSEEFSFRGNLGFMYKGFVFFPVAFFFWLQRSKKTNWIALIILYIAILLTFTRGLWLILFLLYLMNVLILERKRLENWLAISLMLISFGGFNRLVESIPKPYFESQFIGEKSNSQEKERYSLSTTERAISESFNQGFEYRNASMIDRFVQIREVLTHANWSSVFVGHGLGQGTPSRPIHMEISYLEIFQKQGLFGLFLWFFPFTIIAFRFKKLLTYNSYINSTALPWFASVLFFYGISFFNPYLNTPMGIGFIAVTMIVFRHLMNSEE